MAQYKTIPLDSVENSEIEKESYLYYERGKDAPDEIEVENAWIAKRELLRKALGILTPRQREVFILRTVYQLTEAEIASKLNIAQQIASRHYLKAQEKLAKFAVNIAEKQSQFMPIFMHLSEISNLFSKTPLKPPKRGCKKGRNLGIVEGVLRTDHEL